ncbi:MAG: hypothetical protein KBA31_04460 [Alphaproteobacteria bacterium]|nr:hypothetical protein [Alphaproteobacteria bacterium]
MVVPFAPKVDSQSSYYAVHRRADGARPEVKALLDWLVKKMAAFWAKYRAVPSRT